MLAGTGAHAADGFLPRAWLVSDGKTHAVLVAESHFGTPVEQDSYYDAVVQPSYQVADAAVMETYFGRTNSATRVSSAARPATPHPTTAAPSAWRPPSTP